MKRINLDAYGAELLDFYKGEKHSEFVEREDGLIDVGDHFSGKLYFSDYKDWPPEDKYAIGLVTGTRILDIGCGAGRHSLYLKKRGLNVISIDNSPGAIQVCKLRGLKKAQVLSISDVQKLKPKKFDSVIMLGNNIGLLGSLSRGKSILKKLFKLTSPKALIIATGIDPHVTNDPLHLKYQSWNKKRSRMPGQIRMRVRHKDIIGAWFDYLFLSKKELLNLLQGTGWKLKEMVEKRGFNSYVAVLEKGI